MTDKLPPGWARTTVGELCNVEYGKGLSKKQRVESGEILVYGSAGPTGHHDRALVEEPVIVVGRKGNAGAVWLTDRPSWPIDTTYFLRPPQRLLPDFLALQLRHSNLVGLDSSTTIPSLRRPDLQAAPIALPPAAEQKRIVDAIEEHFSRLDAAEATLRQTLTRLDTLRSSILTDAFNTHRELPAGWEKKSIAEVARVQLGRQRSPQHHSGEQMRPYLRAANVTWNGILLDDVKTMNFDDADFEKYRLAPGDLLLNEASGSPNEVGKPAIWDGQIEDCCFQNTLLRLRPKDVALRYLYWYCHLSAGSGKFGEAGRGVNIRHLGKQGLARFPIRLAPRAIQDGIAARIDLQMQSVEELQETVRAALDRVATLRRAVLTSAFSGRLVPQDPDDEPASALLERIATGRQPATPRR